MKNYNIETVEALTLDKVQELALEKLTIKEHDCYIVDFGDYFGYSILVFKNGKHIYFANDYELHHRHLVKEKGKEALRQYYIDTLNNKLFTDSELMENVSSYDEYQRKDRFLRSYYIMRYDHVSAFCIGNEQEKELENKKKTYKYYNPVSFCYMKESEKDVISTQRKISNHLDESYKNLAESANGFREMIASELANHEACITYSYVEALAALGMKFDELSEEKQKIVKEELIKQINSYSY